MAIKPTGNNKTNKLDLRLGAFAAVGGSTKDMGEAGIFLRVFPKSQPEASIAGIEIMILLLAVSSG
jgi:hypothetical protein